MKRGLIYYSVAIILFFLGTTVTYSLPIVSVDTDPSTLGVQSDINLSIGNPFTVEIVVEGIVDDPLNPFDGLHAFEFDLDYDTAILNPVSVVSGGYLGPFFPFGTAFLVESDITAPDINYAETTLGATGFFGNDTIATITFDTIGTGMSLLALNDVILSAPFGVPISFSSVDGSANVIPAPGTLLLFGIGLIGVACYWWKSRRIAAS